MAQPPHYGRYLQEEIESSNITKLDSNKLELNSFSDCDSRFH